MTVLHIHSMAIKHPYWLRKYETVVYFTFTY